MLLYYVAVFAGAVGWTASFLAKTYLTRPVPLLGDWFILRYAENPGIAFGLRIPSPYQEILILVALFLVLHIAIHSRFTVARVGFGLILGGAFANIIDRLPDGFVTDYFAVESFPVFNLPDSCITVGAALILAESVGMFRYVQRKT